MHLLQELASILIRVLNRLHKPVVEANAAFDVDWAQDRFVGRRVTHSAADLLAEIIFDLSALFVLVVSQLQHLRYSELEAVHCFTSEANVLHYLVYGRERRALWARGW